MTGQAGIVRRTRGWRPTRKPLLAVAAGLIVSVAARATDPPAPADGAGAVPGTLPQEGFFSSVKQSMRQGFDHEVVRGHFDLDASPKPRRYYCLVDTKTGVDEPNGVLGEPTPLPDGSTGLKIDAVSLYSCATAQTRGLLVTTGYVLTGRAAAVSRPAAPPASIPAAAPALAAAPPPPAQPAPPAAAPPGAASPAAGAQRAERIDVAGVRLGMTLDEVRTVLKSKQLHDYQESAETLSYWSAAKHGVVPLTNGRFINVITARTVAAAQPAGITQPEDGESFEVMFTPTPGTERAMAVVHTVGYSPAKALREATLEDGLIRKYGALPGTAGLPQSPTWRYLSSGNVLGADGCDRRGLFGGLGSLSAGKIARENIALKRAADELQYEIDRCGAALVTEDHMTAGGGTLPEDRLVTRYTVTAYAPPIAAAGAAAATRMIQSARGPQPADAARAQEAAPNL